MNRKRIETGQELLIILLNHLALISFGVLVMGHYEQDNHMVWLWSLLLLIPLFFYWARITISNFFLFMVLHLIIPVGLAFLPLSVVPKIVTVFIGVVYSIWSVCIRTKGQRYGEGLVTPVCMIGVLAVMLLIEIFHSQRGWEGIYIAMAIIYAVGHCVYMFTSQYLRFLTVNEDTATNIPETEIFHNGLRQTFLYSVGMVTFLVLTAKVEGLSYIFSWIISLLGNLFRKIVRLVFMDGDSTEKMSMTTSIEETPLDLEKSVEVEEAALDLGMPEEMAVNWEVLEKPLMLGVALILVGLTVFGIVKGFQYLWKGFHKDASKDEEKNSNSIDIRESCIIEKSKKDGNNRFLFLNNGEKIRKIFRKQVLKHKTAIIRGLDAEYLEYMTAKECCVNFAAEQLKEMYEKVRYSAEKITSDDVIRAKSDFR